MSIKTLKETAREAETNANKYRELYEAFEAKVQVQEKVLRNLAYDKRAVEQELKCSETQVKIEIKQKDRLEKDNVSVKAQLELIEPKVLDLE